jgi:hypothetical protein
MTGSPSPRPPTSALLDRLTLQRVLVVAALTFAAALVFIVLAAQDAVPVELVAAVPFAIALLGVAVLLAWPVKTRPETPPSEPTSGGEDTAREAEVGSIKAQVRPGEVELGSIKAREVRPVETEVLVNLSHPALHELARQVADELDQRGYVQAEGLPELMESVTSGAAKSKTKGALEGAKEKLLATTRTRARRIRRSRSAALGGGRPP